MKKYNKFLAFLFCIIVSLGIKAQRNSEKADRYFNQNQFESAIKYYLLEANSDNKKAKEYAMAKLADCYRIIGEFEKAEEVYRKILKRKKTVPDNYLNYALSLKSSAKYAEAKLQFEEYIKLKPEDPMGKVYLQSCDSAQKWLDETIGKEVKNIENINTEFSDFGTSFNNNELFFSSAREGSKQAFISFDGGGEVHRMDLYKINLAKLLNKNVNLKDIENIKSINSPLHEGTPTFSRDGQEMYFSKTVKGVKNEKNNNILNVLQVFYSKKDSVGNWSTPVSAFPFNSNSYSVGQPCLSADGQAIFFMSDMPGGFGKTDIYYSTKTPGNKIWSKPKNLGKEVNTFGNELFPTITTDNVLYFSSNSHPGMGQLDVFKSQLIDNVWSNVQNLKPPINSIANDFAITFDDSNARGFFSSDRFNGKGAEDIYSFAFDSPFQLYLCKDSLIFNNNIIYDDIKYKLMNESDSTTEDLATDLLGYKIKLDANKQYTIVLKKSGLPIGKVKLAFKQENAQSYYTLYSESISVKIKGKLLNADNKIKITATDNVEESIKMINQESYEVINILVPEKEYRIFL